MNSINCFLRTAGATLAICDRIERDVLAWLSELKISLLFRLQLVGKVARRFQDPCLIKPSTEQISLASV